MVIGRLSRGDCSGLSHYARFFEIHAEREWRANDTAKKGPTGTAEPVDWAGAASFKPNPSVEDFEEGSDAHAISLAFASNYTALLAQLHDVFVQVLAAFDVGLLASYTLGYSSGYSAADAARLLRASASSSAPR